MGCKDLLAGRSSKDCGRVSTLLDPRPCAICGEQFQSKYDSRVTCSNWCRQRYRERNVVLRRYCPACEGFYVQEESCLRCGSAASPKYPHAVEWEMDEDEPRTLGNAIQAHSSAV